jgi:hypothetical protein
MLFEKHRGENEMKNQGYKMILGLVMALAGLFLSVPRATAAENAFSGIVTQVSPSRIELQKGTEAYRFSLKSSPPKQLKVGDFVTITAEMEVKSIHVDPRKKQEAGIKGHEILDDRAFYSAGAEPLDPVPQH